MSNIYEAGDLVYVRDPDYSWVPAQVISADGSSIKVNVELPVDWKNTTADVGEVTSASSSSPMDINLVDYDGELPRQNVDKKGDLMVKADMVDLDELHEAGILYNLKDRHFREIPYTRVGNITVAVNPFKFIKPIYSDETKQFYADRLVWKTAVGSGDTNGGDPEGGVYDRPHLYETACRAYTGLIMDRRDQTLLVSGESGAGKTVTVRIVMEYLATITSTSPAGYYGDDDEGDGGEKGGHSSIVDDVQKTNPVFEAFGNAKTVRNNNSSRFGKFTKLEFDVAVTGAIESDKIPKAELTGSSFETYLLEKSRVVSHDAGERSYQIFYQLLAAPAADRAAIWSGLGDGEIGEPEDFRYLKNSPIEGPEGNDDANLWKETVEGLDTFGMKAGGDSYMGLMRGLCAVLQLGNITFGPDPNDPETKTVVTSKEELGKLSELLGVPVEDITSALITRVKKTRFEEITFGLRPDDAEEGADALAKEIYSRIFDYLVVIINKYTTSKPDLRKTLSSSSIGGHNTTRRAIISMLDIFGFESFKVNRFEQMCINYANEAIQQKYVQDVFQSITDEYAAEGIELSDGMCNFDAVDNKHVVKAIEGRTGILTVLNEECIRPRGSDESFVSKVGAINKDSKAVQVKRLFRPYEFAICHSAGTVKYDARGFVDKNMDTLPPDLVDVICACNKNNLLRDEFTNLKDEMGKKSKSKKANTVVSKFKTQIQKLVQYIEPTVARYIRCIKPNSAKVPHLTEHTTVMSQLRSAGIVTAITISKETLPNQLTYPEILDKYDALLPTHLKGPTTMPEKDLAEALLESALSGQSETKDDYACGKTKVFFGTEAYRALGQKVKEIYGRAATIIQSRIRGYLGRKYFRACRKAVLWVQTRWKTIVRVREFKRIRENAIKLQATQRRWAAKRKVRKERMEKAAIKIQKVWRGRRSRLGFSAFKRALKKVQRQARVKNSRAGFKSGFEKVAYQVRQQLAYKKLRNGLDDYDESKTSKKIKHALILQSEQMLSFFDLEVAALRAQMDQVNATFTNQHTELMNMQSKRQSAEAALEATKGELKRSRARNNHIMKKVDESEQIAKELKAELTKLRKEQESASKVTSKELEEERLAHKLEIAELKKELSDLGKRYETEVITHSAEAAKIQQRQDAKVTKLEKEIEEMQEEHYEDLARMFTALEEIPNHSSGKRHQNHRKLFMEQAQDSSKPPTLKTVKKEDMNLAVLISDLKNVNTEKIDDVKYASQLMEKELSALRKKDGKHCSTQCELIDADSFSKVSDQLNKVKVEYYENQKSLKEQMAKTKKLEDKLKKIDTKKEDGKSAIMKIQEHLTTINRLKKLLDKEESKTRSLEEKVKALEKTSQSSGKARSSLRSSPTSASSSRPSVFSRAMERSNAAAGHTFDIEAVVNKVLQKEVKGGPIVSSETFTCDFVQEYGKNTKFFFATLKFGGKEWDPADGKNLSTDPTSANKVTAKFFVPMGFIGERMGKVVYKTEDDARNAVMFYILHRLDGRGTWAESYFQENKNDEESDDDDESYAIVSLRRPQAKRGGWFDLVKKGKEFYVRVGRKSILIGDDDEEDEE